MGITRAEAESVRKQLLASCEVCASVPATALYSPNYSVGAGGLGIVGKLPLRLYVGVRRAAEKADRLIRCAETHTFNPELGKEREGEFERIKREPLRSDVLDLLVSELGLESAVELVIWSEFPFQRGLNCDAAIATAVAAALCIFRSEKPVVAARELELFARAGSADVLRTAGAPGKPYNPLAARIFQLAIKLESAMFRAPADGHFILGSLLDSTYAIAFCRSADPSSDAREATQQADWWFQTGQWWGSQVEDLWPESPGAIWPVAVALWFVSQGDSSASKGILRESSLKPHIAPLEALMSRADRPLFWLEGAPPEGELLKAYRRTAAACSVRVLQTLKRALTEGKDRVKAFCDAQDRCQALLRMVERSPEAAQSQATKLAAAAEELSVSIGARFEEYGRHGYLLVVGEPIHLRRVIDKASEQEPGRAHFYFEPDNLESTGLTLRVAEPQRVDLRILRDGKWGRPVSPVPQHLADLRLHMLVRGEPRLKRWKIAWCHAENGPNVGGDRYEDLCQKLTLATGKRGEAAEGSSTPTLALLLASLSDADALTLPLVKSKENLPRRKGQDVDHRGAKVLIPFRKGTADDATEERSLSAVDKALSEANRLMEEVTQLSLGGLRSGGTKTLKEISIQIHPDAQLTVGVEIES